MRKLLIQSWIVSMLVASLSPVSFAQSGRERVRFTRGSNSAVLNRTLSADVGTGNITFIVNANKGQIMKFSVAGARGISVSLDVPKAHDPELQSEAGKSNEYKVVKSGEHYITVVNHTGIKAPFTLKLQILDAPKSSSKGRTPAKKAAASVQQIRLAKGEQVADLKGTLGPKQSKKYAAYVLKGNMITIVPQNNLSSSIRVRLNGKEFDFRDSTSTNHQTQSRNHIIEIYNTASQKIPYHFNVGFSQHG